MSRAGIEAAVLVLPTASLGPESEDDLLDAAFELAFFIHPDRPTALAICRDAMQKLEVAASAQVKRLYYRPKRDKGRAAPAGAAPGLVGRPPSSPAAHLLRIGGVGAARGSQ